MTQVIARRADFTDMDTKNVEEAMYAAGHDFAVEMVPLTLPSEKVIWDKQGVVRTDNGQYLGAVGNRTSPIQPIDFYSMAQSLIDSTGGRITSGITLDNGAVIGISFTLDKREYVSGDVVALNFLMLTSYNNSYAILGRAISHRFACLNQLPSSTKLFNIKNTIGNVERLSVATKMLSYYGQEMRDFDQKMKLLVDHKINDSRAMDWFGNLLPAPKEDSQRSNTRYDNIKDEFGMLLNQGLGVRYQGVRGTAYGALNALTEYCNHERSTRVKEGKTEEQVRFESNVLGGSSDKLMAKGFGTLVEIAKTVPSGTIV
jgi:phage/plasmid-like protein (TIGR03299 family)